MSDFASAAMIRVLTQGMRELGLESGALVSTPADARVDLGLKRTLVARAVQLGGLGCLPLLGRGLHRLAHEPTHRALAAARHPRDLFERWQRLERYIHSRHRCVVHACTDTEAWVEHVSIGSAPAPSAAEDLVVVGVLAALLESIGLREVRAHAGDAAAYPHSVPGALEKAAACGTSASWHFAWSGQASRGAWPPNESPAQALGADPSWSETTKSAYLRLAADLTRPLPLRELASDIGVPWRTLQRRLAEGGLSYSRLLAEARCRAGAWRLLYTPEPIAVVGFLCGFADQPHFTREMQRRVGMTPAAYRDAFGPDAGLAERQPSRRRGDRLDAVT
jgi:AraC-like DNA-binding protein